MTRTMLCFALLLTGCSSMPPFTLTPPPKMGDLNAMCASLPFKNYRGCIQSNLTAYYPNWRGDRDGDLVSTYFAWLEAAEGRVVNGTMSEADAKYGAAEIFLRMRQYGSQRDANTAISQQAAINNMLVGLALVNASQPQPGPMIVCNTSAPPDRGYGTYATTVCR